MVLLLVGLVMLIGGAELLVRGGGRLALSFRVPVIVVGLTVVALGTSMPEILVSVTAAARGSTDMALGNVLGSNIANIALVLGLASLVRPIAVGRELMRREVPAVLLLQLMIPVLMIDQILGRLDGLLLVMLGAGYNYLLIVDAMAGRRPLSDDDEIEEGGDRATNLALFLVGLVVLLVGAQFFVDGAVQTAELYGLDERMIGLTVVALGTSAPEVVTAMVSSYRDQGDMAVGNSLGSNILNISVALGLTAIIHPIPLSDPESLKDMGVGIVVTALLVPVILRRRDLGRSEGMLLLAIYVVYVAMLPGGG